MSFEFKKAFAKATELRSLTFSQQWTMTDESIFTTESPVSMALFNVPPGYTQPSVVNLFVAIEFIEKVFIYSSPRIAVHTGSERRRSYIKNED